MIPEGDTMSLTVAGFVKNGVVVPKEPLPDGAFVEIRVVSQSIEVSPELRAEFNSWDLSCTDALKLTPSPGRAPAELRRMPREQRQAILAAAAELAEEDYRTDKELTGFDAFSEEERNDDESDPG
jgi:hypothetical protein